MTKKLDFPLQLHGYAEAIVALALWNNSVEMPYLTKLFWVGK